MTLRYNIFKLNNNHSNTNNVNIIIGKIIKAIIIYKYTQKIKYPKSSESYNLGEAEITFYSYIYIFFYKKRQISLIKLFGFEPKKSPTQTECRNLIWLQFVIVKSIFLTSCITFEYKTIIRSIFI
jgi:hypothetical protein